MDKYINYNSTSELHRELTNILLLCIEDSNSFYYSYCGEEFGECSLCQLTEFLTNVMEESFMDALSPRRFLAKNYNKKSKLDEFALKILPFFEKMKKDCDQSLDFFKRKYHWFSRDRITGIYYDLTLEEVIENEILSEMDDNLKKVNLNI